MNEMEVVLKGKCILLIGIIMLIHQLICKDIMIGIFDVLIEEKILLIMLLTLFILIKIKELLKYQES